MQMIREMTQKIHIWHNPLYAYRIAEYWLHICLQQRKTLSTMQCVSLRSRDNSLAYFFDVLLKFELLFDLFWNNLK